MNDQTHDFFDNKWIVRFVKKHFKIIIFIGFSGAIITYFAAAFSKKSYVARSVIYPVSSDPETPAKIVEGNMLLLLQILESNDLYTRVGKTLGLYTIWHIDSTSGRGESEMIQRLKKATGFQRTSYRALEIKFRDTDPELAAKICNCIVEEMKWMNHEVAKSQLLSYLEVKSHQLNAKYDEIDRLSAEIAIQKKQKVDSATQRLALLLNQKNHKISEIRSKLSRLRTELGVHSLAHQIDALNRSKSLNEAQLKATQAKLKIYENKLSPADTLRIKTEAQLAGLLKKHESISAQLDKLIARDREFNELSNSLSLLIQSRDRIVNRLETIQATFEPGVESITLQQKHILLQKELDNLANIKSEYEKAKAQMAVFEPGLSVISKATPPIEPSNISPFILSVLTFIAISILTFLLLLVRNKNENI